MDIVNIVHIAIEIWGSIFCLIAAVCVAFRKNLDLKERSLLMGMQLEAVLLLVSDAVAWGFRGSLTEVGYIAVRLSNFMVFITSYAIMINYAAYLQYYVAKVNGRNVRKRTAAVFFIAAVGIIMVVITQFNDFLYYFDENNFYHRSGAFPVSQIIGIIGGFIELTIIIQYRKSFTRAWFAAYTSYIVLPVIAAVIQIFVYGISILNISVVLSVLFMFLVSIVEQENYLNKLQTDVMMSQIGEHFIFNSLSTIKNLCHTSPEEVENSIDEFAKYLRGNIDAISINTVIPFSRELEHVKNYLSLEKRRFGDRLSVKYDIKTEDFYVPPLTLQPLVENAVKHGISKKTEGGTVTIATREVSDGYELAVIDDGVGFDTGEKKNDGKNHIGVANVRMRVDAMCDGLVEIDSSVGKGTSAYIFIRKQKRGQK